MKCRSRDATYLVVLLVELLFGASDALAAPVIEGPVIGTAVSAGSSARVRELRVRSLEPQLERDINPRHRPVLAEPSVEMVDGGPTDPLLDAQPLSSGPTPAASQSFDGIGNRASVTPPDPIGAVGLTEYVQLVNRTLMAVFDKSGKLLHGPVQLNDLWTTGRCSTITSGDPVVVYDTLADRWVVAQLRGSGICMAVSKGPSALDAFHTYEFIFPRVPDYYKIGVWPDAYYLGSNEAKYSAYALDRISMLSGLPASFVRFTGQTNFLMPASVGGGSIPPPVGSPGLFYTFKDNLFHGGTDRLEIFQLHVDWAVPGHSTFVLADSLDVTPYTYTVCGFFQLSCIPQPDVTRRLDAVSEWPMWPLAYRNFGDHEALVANFAIDVGGQRAGIRWYELRRSTGGWTIFQEGTHAPGQQHRWMASIGMDGFGNIAVGYSLAWRSGDPHTAVYPSLAYATRLATDPLNTLQDEAMLVTGGGSQTGTSRWGDYSAMSVDPIDACTFWYTGEYYAKTSARTWRTRIGSFKLPGCP